MCMASASTVVKLHELNSGQCHYIYEPYSEPQGPCNSISWCKYGHSLAMVPYFGITEIISLEDSYVKILIKNIAEPTCATFENSNKDSVAIGTRYGQILIYDIKTDSINAEFPKQNCPIVNVGFTSEDTHCYAGSFNGKLLLFDNLKKQLVCSTRIPKSHSLSTVQAHLHNRNFIIGGSDEGVVAVWDTNANKIKFCSDAHDAPITATLFSPINANVVISAGIDRQVCVFDINDDKMVACIPVENSITSMDFMENTTTHIAMGSQNGKIYVYDFRNFQMPLYSFQAHDSAIKHMAFQKSTKPFSDSCNYLTKTTNSNSSMRLLSFVSESAGTSLPEVPVIMPGENDIKPVIDHCVNCNPQNSSSVLKESKSDNPTAASIQKEIKNAVELELKSCHTQSIEKMMTDYHKIIIEQFEKLENLLVLVLENLYLKNKVNDLTKAICKIEIEIAENSLILDEIELFQN